MTNICNVLDIQEYTDSPYKKHVQIITTDIPYDDHTMFESFEYGKIGLIGFLGSTPSNPIFLRPESITAKEKDGQLYLAIVREGFEKI